MRPPLRFAVEKRAVPSLGFLVLLPVVYVVMGLLVASVPLLLVGENPLDVYRVIADSSFGSMRGFTDTLTAATPTLLTGLAAVIAFRAKVFNIGAEGQLLVGAIGAAGVGLLLPAGTTPALAIGLMVVAGLVAGAFYASLAAAPLVAWNANPVVTTLLLNFLALGLINYLILGTDSLWAEVMGGFPRGKLVPDAFRLPELSGRLNVGFLIAVLAIVVFAWFLRFTTWGFEYSVVADSPGTARYAGINQRRIVMGTFLLSGAAAGLAGAVLVSGTVGSLEPRSLAVGLGYSGILAAAFGRFSPIGLIPAAIFVAALVAAGPDLQRIGVHPSISVVIQGVILVVITAGQFFVTYRLVGRRRRGRPGVKKEVATSTL